MPKRVLRLYDRRVRRINLELATIRSFTAINCRFFNITASAIAVYEGIVERCLFKDCVFDNSSLVLTFRDCEFSRCYIRGASGFRFENCRCSRVQLFNLAGCTIQGGSLYRCVIDSDLPLAGTSQEFCESITSQRGIQELPHRNDYEPYEESFFPSYRSVGEILSAYNPKDRPHPGAVKAGVRDLREARAGLPAYPQTLKIQLCGRLKRPQTFGLSDDARNVLFWLVSVDRTVRGLVWPTVNWLAGRCGIAPAAVLDGLAELKSRGWLHHWVHTRDLDAAWLDYEYAQRHFDSSKN